MVEVKFSYKYIDPTDGTYYDQGVKDWSILMNDMGYPRTSVSDTVEATVPNISVNTFLKVSTLEKGDIKYWQAWMKIQDINIDNEIPEGLPNRTYEVCISDCETENPVYETRVHTWRTWRDVGHPLPDPLEDPNDNLMYYYTLTYTFGQTLTMDELLIIHNSADAVLIDYADIPFPTEPGEPTNDFRDYLIDM